MLNTISNHIVQWLSFSMNMTEDQTEVCRYGCESFLYSTFSTVALLLTGVLFGALLETIAIVSVFYCCQSLGGGFHASSHIKCFFTMFVGLYFCFEFLQVCNADYVYLMLALLSFLILLLIPIQLHENKYYLNKKKGQFVIISRSLVCLIMFITIHAMLVGSRVFCPLCLGMSVSAVSRFIARALKKKTLSMY